MSSGVPDSYIYNSRKVYSMFLLPLNVAYYTLYLCLTPPTYNRPTSIAPCLRATFAPNAHGPNCPSTVHISPAQNARNIILDDQVLHDLNPAQHTQFPATVIGRLCNTYVLRPQSRKWLCCRRSRWAMEESTVILRRCPRKELVQYITVG